ncbi:MAG: cohesin domain-containing protein, partial [Euryarchaeota archaeon]|nr:cohesin domain-containing protein [Euryarchaeota archaeon]
MEGKGKSSKLSIAWSGIAVLLVSIAFTSLLAAPVMAQEAEVTVTVNAPEYVDERGTFAATIDVDSVTDLNSAQFDLSFDSSVVMVSDVNDGKINGEDIPIAMWVLNPAKDTVRVIANLEEGGSVSGSGYLAEVELRV